MGIKHLLEKKHDVFTLDGDYATVLGTPECSGVWLLYGAEKNGKTWSALMLANYLSNYTEVLFISAEQGTDKEFVQALKRAGISHDNKALKVIDGEFAYEAILEKFCGKRRKTKVVFIDNITFYKDELKGNKIQRLMKQYPDVLFIYIAHEDKNKPYGSTAQMCARLAKVIIRVQGLQAQFLGRCPGGVLNIDDSKAQLYWGLNNNN